VGWNKVGSSVVFPTKLAWNECVYYVCNHGTGLYSIILQYQSSVQWSNDFSMALDLLESV